MTTLPRNIKAWTYITQNTEGLVLVCKECGLIHTFSKNALSSAYLVCDTCGA